MLVSQVLTMKGVVGWRRDRRQRSRVPAGQRHLLSRSNSVDPVFAGRDCVYLRLALLFAGWVRPGSSPRCRLPSICALAQSSVRALWSAQPDLAVSYLDQAGWCGLARWRRLENPPERIHAMLGVNLLSAYDQTSRLTQLTQAQCIAFFPYTNSFTAGESKWDLLRVLVSRISFPVLIVASQVVRVK